MCLERGRWVYNGCWADRSILFIFGMVSRARAYVTFGLDLTSPGHDLHCSTQFPHCRLTDTRHKQRKI
jgi:hypothetical protein